MSYRYRLFVSPLPAASCLLRSQYFCFLTTAPCSYSVMSDSPENSAIMRAIVEGARDFLLKPLRVEELKVLWQHVVRYTSEITKLDGTDPAKVAGPGPSKVAGDTAQSKEETDSQDKDSEGNASKKQRVIWSPEMHQQFVNAVNQLGIDKAVPKRILDLMNIEGLTRENVASHLQKYRLYLKRMASTQDSSQAASDLMTTSSENFGALMGGQQMPLHSAQPGSVQQQQVHYLAQQQQPSSGPMQHMPGQIPGAQSHMGMVPANQMQMHQQQVIQMSNGSHVLVTMPPHQPGMPQGMISHEVLAGQHPGMVPHGVMHHQMLHMQQQQQTAEGIKRDSMEQVDQRTVHAQQQGMNYMPADGMGAPASMHMGMNPQGGMPVGAQMEYAHGGQGASNWQMPGGGWQMGN
mmetsp:Transcript_24530/g.68262  ORF Transcript_24530/g.68262 Transcript_24530/m.68262 type:complete len:405 (-) Transcript_24530:340-1554(-)